MKNVDIKRISKEYVKDDCAQVMFAFRKNMTLEKEGTKEQLFYYKKKNLQYVNHYLKDDRRHSFPFGNIPVHREKRGFRIYNVTNQILSYDTVYKLGYPRYDGDKRCLYLKVIKDNENALLLTGETVKSLEINLDKIKNLETLGQIVIKKCPRPRFALSINKNITRKDIREGKKLTKKRTK